MPCVEAHRGSVDRNWTSRAQRALLTRGEAVAISDLVYHYSIHSPIETLRSYLAAMAQFTKKSPRNSPEAAPPLITRRNFYAYTLSVFLINLRILYTGGTTVIFHPRHPYMAERLSYFILAIPT